VLSRTVAFQFALDPNDEHKVLLARCAGARRFTLNHHPARVKANLDARWAAMQRHDVLPPLTIYIEE
jgi:hypothetical protein